MANMSYCRFENTLGDLRDCAHALRDKDGIGNEHEARAARRLLALCKEIAEQFTEEDIEEMVARDDGDADDEVRS